MTRSSNNLRLRIPPGYAGENCGEKYSKIGAVAVVWRSHAAGIGAARARAGIVWFCRPILLMLDANRPDRRCARAGRERGRRNREKSLKISRVKFYWKLFSSEFDKDVYQPLNIFRYLEMLRARNINNFVEDSE